MAGRARRAADSGAGRGAGGRRIARDVAVASAVAVALVALVALATVARAAGPSPTPAGGGDVRTNPTAPGLVGDPLVAILGVVLVGILAVALTLVATRIAERR
jgi:hypothetical protein